jgi:putative ABC transport system permease protein
MLSDFRLAARGMARSWGFTAVAAATLALGIGLNTVIFSGVHSFLFDPLPYSEPDSLIAISQTRRGQGMQELNVSWLDAEDWRAARSIESLTLFTWNTFALSGAGEAVNVDAVLVTPGMFSTLRVQPALGRAFGVAEENVEEHRVALLTDGFWKRQFGADPGVIGREIRLDGKNHVVLGVMPSSFTFLYEDVALLLPLHASPESRANRGRRSFSAIGRLRPGATLAELHGEIGAISVRLEREVPATNQGWAAVAQRLDRKIIPDGARNASYIVLAAVGFVLLIACANIANLLLARGTLRQRELAVRASLGANRPRLARLLLAESLLLAAFGALLGLGVAFAGMPVLQTVVPPDTPRAQDLHLSWAALFYTMAITVVTGIAAGVAPAWLLTAVNPATVLQSGGRGSAGGRNSAMRLLVVAEIAVVIVLLAMTGTLIRSLRMQLTASPGFEKENLLRAFVLLPQHRYPEGPSRSGFFSRVLAELAGKPGVVHAAAVDTLPLSGSRSATPIVVEGQRNAEAGEQRYAGRSVVSPGYFRTLGVDLLAGRDLDERDGAEAPRVAVVNATMARHYWGGEEGALGRRFRVEGGPAGRWITVAGVVKDVRHQGAARPVRREYFLPMTQASPRSMDILVRTAGEPGRVAPEVRRAIRAVDADQPVLQMESVVEMIQRRQSSVRAMTTIMGMLSALGLTLAAIGLYGAMSYMTAQREREIGIRMAVGAQPADVLRGVMKSGLAITGAGLLIGLPLAYASTPVLRSVVAGFQENDWITFGGVALMLALVGLAACVIPAVRATRLDPVTTLRAE